VYVGSRVGFEWRDDHTIVVEPDRQTAQDVDVASAWESGPRSYALLVDLALWLGLVVFVVTLAVGLPVLLAMRSHWARAHRWPGVPDGGYAAHT
jgi:hypothetical protein